MTNTFQELNAFWQHFSLHKRPCDKTGRTIISVFGEDCPYPVWHREEWLEHADPPTAEWDSTHPFFEQLWDLFQNCPIAHNVGTGNINCEYTDDWWYSKNSYLSHSGLKCEDVSYCYRCIGLKDCLYCVFSFDSERCVDLVNSYQCYNTSYALNSRQCRDSAFLFDCRNCSDCLFSWNLRNKQYCIFNKQYSKEAYEVERAKYDLSSRATYQKAKRTFHKILEEKAWWPNLSLVQCEASSGDHLDSCKQCDNCFFLQDGEDCEGVFRAHKCKDVKHSVSVLQSEKVLHSSQVQDNCYDIAYCYNLVQCRFMEYSAHCYKSENCFGCCGLVGKQYHIFNKPYSPEAYAAKVQEIKAAMRAEGVYGQFFPGHFAANPYEESLAHFHWPLSPEQQAHAGFRLKHHKEQASSANAAIAEIPDRASEADSSLSQKIFWDEESQKVFQIPSFVVDFCQKNRTPLPDQHYIRRIKENFSWMFFRAPLRETRCADTGVTLMTSLPDFFEGRILSVEAYRRRIY